MPQSLHSLLLSKKSAASSPVNYVRQIPDESSPSHAERHVYTEQHFFSEETELAGTSEMVYDDSLLANDIDGEGVEAEMSTGSTFESKLQDAGLSSALVTRSLGDTLNHQSVMRKMETERESLRAVIQQQLRQIASLERSAVDYSSLRDELSMKTAELEEIKSSLRRAKQDNEASLQRVSSENEYLKSAHADVAADSYSSERKCVELDAARSEVLQKIKGLEVQLNDAGITNRKSTESLQSLQRQISQLDSENILLRQLRADFDVTSRECTQQRRQVAALEAEVMSLKTANTQLRQSASSTSGKSHSIGSSSHRVSPSAALSQTRGDRDRDLSNRSEFESFPPPSPFMRDSGAVNQQHPSAAYPSRAPQPPQSLSAFASSSSASFRGSAEVKGMHIDTDYSSSVYSKGGEGSDPQRSWDNDYKREQRPVSTSNNVRSLADVVGNRRSTVGYAETSSRDTGEEPRRSRSDFPSSSGNEGSRNWNGQGRDGTSSAPAPVGQMMPASASDRRHTLEGRSHRGNSSGGVMSSFYDDTAEPTARAPFGTEQSAAHNLLSFEDTDRRLTALMTEKSVLYEESARLLQRGGKVLKDRARLQHVDARLEEVGRQIACERKKLSGKPG